MPSANSRITLQVFAAPTADGAKTAEKLAHSFGTALAFTRAGQISPATNGLPGPLVLWKLEIKMKTLFFLSVVCAFCGTGAMAQVGGSVMSAPTNSTFVVQGHMQRASQTAMASSQNLIGHFSSTASKGERPLWEVMPAPAPEVPLGDIARMMKKEHETAKKAAVSWTN